MILFHQKANSTVKMLLAQTLVRAYKGLSRMRGNLHVRFLGGGGAVMRCCYPTCALRPASFRLQMRWLRSGTPVTYLSKLLGIPELAAFLQPE